MNILDDHPWPLAAIIIIIGIVVTVFLIQIARRTGLSMAGNDTENIYCPIIVNSSVFTDEAFPLRTDTRFVACVRFAYPPATLAFIAGCILVPPWQISFIGVIIFGAGTIFCWCSDWIGFYVYADGISPKSCIETLIRKTDCRKRLVPWSEITSCQVVTVHNKYGDFVRRYPVLKNARDKLVFDGSSSFARQEDLDRLINFIRGT